MAEDKKITDLTALSPLDVAVEDVLVIVDVDINPFLSETKKITVSDLLISQLPGDFSSLQINSGPSITGFSTDTNLGTSDVILPTQNAVKGYVDAAISSLEPDQIWADDSYVKVVDDGTAAGFIEIVADGTQVAYFDSLASTQRIGKQSNAGRLEISDTSSKLFGSNDVYIEVSASAVVVSTSLTEVFKIDENGIKLEHGATVNRISNDPSLLQASETSLITEYAVKQYVDSSGAFGDRIINGLASAIVSDSTDESYFSVKVRDTFFGPDATSYTQIYYFDSTNFSSNWKDSTNMVDGNTETVAQAGALPGAYIQEIFSNNISPSATRNVEKVELRVYGRDGSGPNISAFNFYPLFNLVKGNSQNLRSFLGPVRNWTPWINITQDPKAPNQWLWADVMSLGIKVEAIIGSPGGALGDVVEVNKIEIRVTYTEIPSVIGSVEKLRADGDGVSVQYGATINEFSKDVTMADNSDRAIPTERAVKTYVDYQIQSVRNDLDLINIRYVNTDGTAVTGDVCLVQTGDGPINITMIEMPEGRVIIKKVTLDNNPVYVTTTPGSSIDGELNFVIDVPYKSITFLSDGEQFYII